MIESPKHFGYCLESVLGRSGRGVHSNSNSLYSVTLNLYDFRLLVNSKGILMRSVRVLACVLYLCCLSLRTVSAGEIVVPKDSDYAKPGEEDVKKIDSYLVELDVFFTRQSAWLVGAHGESIVGNRAKKTSELRSISFIMAGNENGAKRLRMHSADLDPTPKGTFDLTGKFVVLSGPEFNVDFTSVGGEDWFVDLESGRGVMAVDKSNEPIDRQMYYHGMFNPIIDSLQVAAPGAPLACPPSQLFPQKNFHSVAEMNGVLFGRWVTPMPRTDNKVLFRSTFAFKEGLPILVVNELGKMTDDVFEPYYSTGSVEIEWKKLSDEDVVPVRVVRRVCMDPKKKNLDVIDRHVDLRFKWFLGKSVPVAIFQKDNLGNLVMNDYMP